MSLRTYTVDGVPFELHAFNTVDLTESALPPLRGSDRELSGVPGATHRPRVAGSITRTLAFYVLGQDFASTESGMVTACWEHYRAIVALLSPPDGRQFALGRRWVDDQGEHFAEALGIALKIEPHWIGEHQVLVTVDVLLADPFFYGPERSAVLALGSAGVAVGGEHATTAVWLDLVGALTNAQVTNATPAPDVWVRIGSSVAAGDQVTVDVNEGTVTRRSDGANLIGAKTNGGAKHWLGLRPGTNEMSLSASAGTGHAVLRWRERWI